MRTIAVCFLLIFLLNCGSSESPKKSIELITNAGQQDSIFVRLTAMMQNNIPESCLSDSLAFLILPVQASCPSCRKKTIDSILKYENNLPPRHFIIISASGGLKTINSYFLEEGSKVPDIEGRLVLDSTNQAYKMDLYKEKPTMYYAFNRKALKKVSARPSTVREDLREFFSGYRKDNQSNSQ